MPVSCGDRSDRRAFARALHLETNDQTMISSIDVNLLPNAFHQNQPKPDTSFRG